MNILTSSQIDSFKSKGYLHCKNVFDAKDALALQNEIWAELKEEFDINKNDSKTWRTPSFSPKKAKVSELNNKVINSKFRAIIDELIGENNWTEPNSWGGFLITFPTVEINQWNLIDKLWHWDYELKRLFKLKGLLIFSFFSKVEKQGGGTLAVSGSHKALEKYYYTLTEEQKKWKHGKQRKHFMKTHPYFNDLINHDAMDSKQLKKFLEQETDIDGIKLQVIELTGDLGDVTFCHPRLIHAPAAINLNTFPRIMRVKFLW